MNEDYRCQDSGCRRRGCRRARHHGVQFMVKCPECGETYGLEEIGNRPAPAMGKHPPKEGKHSDWRHAAGITCGSCNHYFLASNAHPSLADSMEEWERPAPNRPPPDLEAMRVRVRERTKRWRGGGLESQFA